MTIPWIDQSSPSFQNVEPVCGEPVEKEEITPPNTESCRPEFSNIHPERNLDPPLSLKDLEGEISSSFQNLPLFSCYPKTDRHQIYPEPIFTNHLRRRQLDVKAHLQRSGISYEILTCSSFEWFKTFELRELLSESQRQILLITEKLSLRKSISRLRFSRFALFASLALLCLLAIDAENSYRKQNNCCSKRIVPVKVFSETYCLLGITGSLIRKRLQEKEVWINPKRDSRTVGKHRCHCTKNSFFTSHHNTSDSYHLLYPVQQESTLGIVVHNYM